MDDITMRLVNYHLLLPSCTLLRLKKAESRGKRMVGLELSEDLVGHWEI